MSAPAHDPEERWRRTVEQRGRPLKLKIGRLLREFGHHELDAGVRDDVEARLAQVGVLVRPSLRDATADEVITLELAPPDLLAPPLNSGAPPPVPERRFAVTPQPRVGPPPGLPAGLDRVENTPLVRAAVEAEHRARAAYDQAAGAAEDRIARLERELAMEREAIARTRDERDQLEQRMHVERRQAAARLQALAAAERTALRLLEAERAELTSRARAQRPAVEIEPAAPPRRPHPLEADTPPQHRPHPLEADPPPARRARAHGPDSAPPRRPPVEPPQDLLPAPPNPRGALDLTRAPAEVVPARRGRGPRPIGPRRPAPTAAATLPPAAPRSKRQALRGRGRVGLLVLVPLALLALGVAGYLLGHDEPAAAPPAAPPLAERASRAGLGLTYPTGWVERSSAPELPGLNFTNPIVLSASAQTAAAIVAGVVRDAIGSDLLPATLRKRLPASAPEPEPVLLGDNQALRYAGLRVDGLAGTLTLFAVPTTDGSAVVACRDQASEAADVCERAAATLNVEALPAAKLDGRRALALAPSPSYGKRVATAISALEVAQTIDGDRLRKASTAASQATIAEAIAQTFERADDGLTSGPVSARDRDGHVELAAAIRAGAAAYRRLASAAEDGDDQAYASATDAVLAADGRLREAIGALQALGYTT